MYNLLAIYDRHPMMQDRLSGRDYGWELGARTLMGLLFLGAVTWIAFYAIKSFGNKQGNSSTEAPIEIAKRRYAAGEIDKSAYDKLIKDLSV